VTAVTGVAIRGPRLGRLAAIAAVVLLVAGALWWVLGRDSGTDNALGTRTVTAGAAEVTVTALTLDSTGARFKVKLDTHSGALDTDLPDAAQLRIDGRLAAPGTWNGDGPGGHHREGTLRFGTPVPSGSAVQLRINGLPQDALATWTAP